MGRGKAVHICALVSGDQIRPLMCQQMGKNALACLGYAGVGGSAELGLSRVVGGQAHGWAGTWTALNISSVWLQL